MGIVKKILAMRTIPPVSTLYSDYASIDLSENFHLHWRNCRFVMDDEEARAARALQPSQPEDDAALVLLDDPNRERRQPDDEKIS